MAIKYGPSGKIVGKRFSLARLEEAMRDYHGFCLACGCEHEAIDPDGRKYECERCKNKLVFGAEEIVMMGYVKGGC